MVGHRIRWILTVLIPAVTLSGVRAQAPGKPLPFDSRIMAARIDQYMAARWQEKKAVPAPIADDAEFFRRLSLDITGRIPSITLLQDFLSDKRPDKRQIWLEVLFNLEDESVRFKPRPTHYVNHFSTYWRTVIFAQTTNQQAQFIGFQLDPLLRRHVQDNVSFDRMVRDILTTPQGTAFFQASEGKPENIAGAASRLFLGVKLECAQCHNDKSGGSWTREQFWEFAAFFQGFGGGNRGVPVAQPGVTVSAPKIKIPDKNITVEARFLDGRTPAFDRNQTAVAVLAEWMTAPDNPYFARAAVNRMWYYFLGTGLTDPVDHMATEDNPPSHPELLDEMAAQFVANGFDLKWLIRSITGSKAYQLSSRKTDDSQDDERLFARMAVRGMSPEQLFDSLGEATGYRDTSPAQPNRGFGVPQGTRAEFLAKFTNTTDKRTEMQTSILQALFLMNGGTLNNSVKSSKALKTVQDNTKSPIAKNIEELYLITLSRKPQPHELDRLVRYVEARERAEALADVFWALLNSSEFALNH